MPNEEVMSYLIDKAYWRILHMGKRQGCMKVEACCSDTQPLLRLQATFGGHIKKQDSIWRWSCGRAEDIAHIAVNLLPYGRALGIEMHRYCQATGEKRYKYVQALEKKYGTKSIKISKFATTERSSDAKKA